LRHNELNAAQEGIAVQGHVRYWGISGPAGCAEVRFYPNRTPRRFGLAQKSWLLQQRFQVENRGVLRDAGKSCPQSAIERMTLAGFPPTRVLGGTFLVTTEPAATTEFSPTVTPPMIVAPAAIHTFLSITMGFAIVKAHRRCVHHSPFVIFLRVRSNERSPHGGRAEIRWV
jgi:hypothetical protein